MGKKVAKGFMTIKTKLFRKACIYSLLVATFSIGLGCEDNAPPTRIPFVYTEFTINLNLQEYLPLQYDGGFVYENEGFKGIIIYRESEDKYFAIERACTFAPNKPCEVVSVDQSSFFLIDTCCGSTFDFHGNPTGSPADQPLLLYDTYLDNNFLTITNSNR